MRGWAISGQNQVARAREREQDCAAAPSRRGSRVTREARQRGKKGRMGGTQLVDAEHGGPGALHWPTWCSRRPMRRCRSHSTPPLQPKRALWRISSQYPADRAEPHRHARAPRAPPCASRLASRRLIPALPCSDWRLVVCYLHLN
jgi:hypothetical protein